LHEQLALGDDRIELLEQEGDELRSYLESAQEDASRFETELRVQTRELNNMKVSQYGLEEMSKFDNR